jgi:hypothetical protein
MTTRLGHVLVKRILGQLFVFVRQLLEILNVLEVGNVPLALRVGLLQGLVLTITFGEFLLITFIPSPLSFVQVDKPWLRSFLTPSGRRSSLANSFSSFAFHW